MTRKNLVDNVKHISSLYESRKEYRNRAIEFEDQLRRTEARLKALEESVMRTRLDFEASREIMKYDISRLKRKNERLLAYIKKKRAEGKLPARESDDEDA